jgi:hypothetical protein
MMLMEERLVNKKLLVAEHLCEWFDEYQGYHRVNGLVNKVDDDLSSATGVGCMDLRFAKTVDNFVHRPSSRGPQMARGVDFDLFTGQ